MGLRSSQVLGLVGLKHHDWLLLAHDLFHHLADLDVALGARGVAIQAQRLVFFALFRRNWLRLLARLQSKVFARSERHNLVLDCGRVRFVLSQLGIDRLLLLFALTVMLVDDRLLMIRRYLQLL